MQFEHTKDSKSMLLYCESCEVDRSGLLESVRMNIKDFDEAKRMQEFGFLEFGRIPFKMIKESNTHWVRLTEKGWEEAHKLRKERSNRKSLIGTEIFKELKELGKLS